MTVKFFFPYYLCSLMHYTLAVTDNVLTYNYSFLVMQLSFIKSDLEEMSFIISRTDCSLTEQLLPSKHSFFIRESR